MPLGQEVMTDYATTSLSLKQHPVALIREHLRSLKMKGQRPRDTVLADYVRPINVRFTATDDRF